MTSLPLHPQLVHFPLALSFITPLLAIVVMVMMQKKKWPAMVWAMVVGLQVLTTVSGYVAMELGEDDEDVVERVVGEKALHEHEEKAEMFVAFSVAATAVSVAAFWIKPTLQLYLMLAALAVMIGQGIFAVCAGHSGGELVYIHKAANAYKFEKQVESTEAAESSDSDQDDNDYGAAEASEDDGEDDGEEEAEE